MNETISNESRAERVLAQILEYSESSAAKKKDLSLFEYDLIKTFSENNPTADMHSKLGFNIDDTDAAPMKALLDKIVAVPLGFKSPSSDLSATKLRDAVNRQTAVIIKGGEVSDDTLTAMSGVLTSVKKQDTELTERLDNYKTSNYEKGMVNIIEMQENLDAGKQVFKQGHHMVLTMGFDKDDKHEIYATERKMGIQGTHASMDYPNNDLNFVEIHGDITKAQGILLVVGDTENKEYAKGKATGVKEVHSVDIAQGIALAAMLGIKQKDPQGANAAIISTDVRNLDKFLSKLEKINPHASLSVYTNNRVNSLSMIGNDGKTQAIPSVFEHVENLIKEERFSNNPKNKEIQLLVSRSDDSLVDMYAKTKTLVQAAHPNDPSALYARLNKVVDFIVDDFRENGKTLTDTVKDAYLGRNVAGKYDKDLSVTEKAAFESRRETSINAYGDDAPKKGPFRPELQTMKADAIDSRQASLLEDNSPATGNHNKPDNPQPKQLPNSPSGPRI